MQTTGNSALDLHHAMTDLANRYGLAKGSRYVVQQSSAGYTNAEYIGHGGFRLADGRTVFPTAATIRDITPYIP